MNLKITNAPAETTVEVNGRSFVPVADVPPPATPVVPPPSEPVQIVEEWIIATRKGCVGDRKTDNTEAISRMVGEAPDGAKFHFGAGTFLHSGGINIMDRLGLTIAGAGTDATEFLHSANFVAPSMTLNRYSTGCTLTGFSMNSAAPARTAGGHQIVLNGRGHLVRDVALWNGAEFALFAGSDGAGSAEDITLDNVEANHSRGDGLHFGCVAGGRMRNVRAFGCADDAIAIAADTWDNADNHASDIVLDGFEVRDCGSRGLNIEDAKRITVRNGTIRWCDSAAFWISVWRSASFFNEEITVENVEAYGSNRKPGYGRGAVMAAYTRGLRFKGCHFAPDERGGMNGALLADVHRLAMSGCDFVGVGQHGVACYGDTSQGPDDIGAPMRGFSPEWKEWHISGNNFIGNRNSFGMAANFIPPANIRLRKLRAVRNDATDYANRYRIAYARTVDSQILANTCGELIDGGGNENLTTQGNS